MSISKMKIELKLCNEIVNFILTILLHSYSRIYYAIQNISKDIDDNKKSGWDKDGAHYDREI